MQKATEKRRKSTAKAPPEEDEADEFSLAAHVEMPASMTNSEVEYMTAAQYHTIAQCSGDTFGFKGFLHFWPSEPRTVQLKRQKEGVSVIKIVMADKSAPMHITV